MTVVKDTGERALLPPFADEHEQLRETIARWVREEIAPNLDAWEEAREFPRELFYRAAELGFLGLKYPEELGGQGGDYIHDAVWAEELAAAGAGGGVAAGLGAHTGIATPPIYRFGTEAQHERFLRPAIRGEKIAALGITEPGAGSDVAAINTFARRVDGGYVVNGSKTFITNAPVADLVIVFARTGEGMGPFGITAFLVPAGTPGLDAAGEIDKMGLRTSPMAEVALADCVVPESAVLGRIGRGGDVFQRSMQWERACIMASQVGLMRRTMDTCIAYARERRQFGQPIGRFESIADKIADMRVAVDAGRALALRVGWLMDQGRDTTLESAIAKLFISEANVRTHLDAVQIHGGYGYATEFEIERALRDAVGGRIYSGTSEIQRRIIARRLGL